MNIKNFALLSAAVVALSAAACNKKASEPAQPQSSAAAPAPAAGAAAPAAANDALLHPENLTAQAPDTFKARFSTTKGDFVVQVTRAWAPRGADRFYNLVKAGFYDNTAFFRVIDGFMMQFGINGDPAVNAKWQGADIPDDPPAGQSNARGMVTFATAGPNTRTTQLFVNFGNNAMLDSQGFVPFGQVVDGMNVVDSIYKIGEGAPMGPGPAQDKVQSEGNAYLKASFPQLDYIKKATIE